MVVTRRVLVTRPQPGANATAARLGEMGFSPILLPLTRIEPVEPVSVRDAAAFDAVAITSVNAVRHSSPGLLAALREKPVFAVGEASAAAAREAGFRTVYSAGGTARELAVLIARECRPGSSILHPVGVERTAGFAEALEAESYAVDIVEVYSAAKISYTTDFLSRVAARGPIWGALVLSPRAGTLMAELALRPEMREVFEKTRFFCISKNAAAPLSDLAASRLLISDEPTEQSVLRLLSSQG